MSAGPSQQSFQFALSTSIQDVTVRGIDCASCIGGPGYNLSASSTAIPLHSNASSGVQLVGGSANGSLVLEQCGLVESNGTLWSYSNQSIIVVNQTDFPLSSRTSGIFGLGPNGNNTDLTNTPFGQWFSSHPSSTNFTFGLALNPPRQNSTDAGLLHWSNLDPSAYTGAISTVNAIPPTYGSSWYVQSDGWTFQAPGGQAAEGPCRSIVDPIYPNISLPQAWAREIHSKIPGATPQASTHFEYWQLPCSTTMSLTVLFGGASFTMDQNSLLANSNGLCYSNIVGPVDPLDSTCVFGSAFISTLYLIVTISQLAQMTLGFASRSPSSSSSSSSSSSGPSVVIAGLIAGAVVIGVILLFSLLYIAYRTRSALRLPASQIQLSSPSSFSGTNILYSENSPDSHTSFGQVRGPSDTPLLTAFSDAVPLLAQHRPVTVSIEHNLDNLSSNHSTESRWSPEPILTPPPEARYSPPLRSRPQQSPPQDFTIEPFVGVPQPPPRLTGMDEVKRAFDERRRRERAEEDIDSMANEPGSDARSESSVTVVSHTRHPPGVLPKAYQY